ncbi:hypothetical protein EU95_0555 [Prochlorococcus marinus str. MIT 9201]|uniref:Uncharacterized protein n=1 Tax=Prochlorococcus marinus str. MIT 9201 TaxID=93057 RepID=A0A0A2A4Z4_PROMR|nr:hypothetical protein [Prochlorococcus marinus]KGF96670.1 hypothetical protein EU95_0555 [Prochlorococcus marinus str. MIT 9201]
MHIFNGILIIFLGTYLLLSFSRSFISIYSLLIIKLILPVGIYFIYSGNYFENNLLASFWILFLFGSIFGFKLGLRSKLIKNLVQKTSAIKKFRITRNHLSKLLNFAFYSNLLHLLITIILSFLQTDNDAFQGTNISVLTKSNPLIYLISISLRWSSIISIFSSKYISNRSNFKTNNLIFKILLLFVFTEYITSFQFVSDTSLTSYANKLFQPLLFILYYKFFDANHIGLLKKIFSLRLSKKLIGIIVLIFVFLAAIITFSSIFLGDPIGYWAFKFASRVDGYLFLNSEMLDKLSRNYNNIFAYIAHPFLKLIGLYGYKAPMGTFLLSSILDTDIAKTIGGPNIHLPILIGITYLNMSMSFLIIPFMLILFSGIFGLALSYSYKILWDKNNIFSISQSFISLFIYFSTMRFITEPSVFSHSLMAFICCFVIYKFISKVSFRSVM